MVLQTPVGIRILRFIITLCRSHKARNGERKIVVSGGRNERGIRRAVSPFPRTLQVFAFLFLHSWEKLHWRGFNFSIRTLLSLLSRVGDLAKLYNNTHITLIFRASENLVFLTLFVLIHNYQFPGYEHVEQCTMGLRKQWWKRWLCVQRTLWKTAFYADKRRMPQEKFQW